VAKEPTMRAIIPILLLVWLVVPTHAQLTSPLIGWRAELNKVAHNVSGSVTILDENTVRVDDFTYDGGGIDVFFYLGQDNTRNSFINGLKIGPQLLGTAYNGSQPPLLIDLPAGQTLEGWNAVSVWCVTAAANFGSGTFAPVADMLEGDFNADGQVDSADYVAWRNGLGAAYQPGDYDKWRRNFGTGSAAAAASNSAVLLTSVPEPALFPLLIPLGAIGLIRRYGIVGDRRA
jgi:hypothetical protein